MLVCLRQGRDEAGKLPLEKPTPGHAPGAKSRGNRGVEVRIRSGSEGSHNGDWRGRRTFSAKDSGA